MRVDARNPERGVLTMKNVRSKRLLIAAAFTANAAPVGEPLLADAS